MEFDKPSKSSFTIYSKSGCPNCLKTKSYLKEKNLIFNVVDCDEYIIEDKINFLSFIKQNANEEVKMFPMVFYNGKFIGGFSETTTFVEKLLLSFEESFSF
jgi:glutaredoxin